MNNWNMQVTAPMYRTNQQQVSPSCSFGSATLMVVWLMSFKHLKMFTIKMFLGVKLMSCSQRLGKND